VRGILEHEVHQRDDHDRHHQDHRDAPMVGDQLPQDPKRGGAEWFQLPLKSYPAWRVVFARDDGQKRVLQ